MPCTQRERERERERASERETWCRIDASAALLSPGLFSAAVRRIATAQSKSASASSSSSIRKRTDPRCTVQPWRSSDGY